MRKYNIYYNIRTVQHALIHKLSRFKRVQQINTLVVDGPKGVGMSNELVFPLHII